MGKPVVLDLETQKAFHDVKDRKAERLGVSLVGIYSYETNSFSAYKESELDTLFSILERSSLIVGFNITNFDLPVLRPYYIGDVMKLPQLDMLASVKKAIGRRIALDSLAKETLKVQKSGHGLQAIDYFREGKWDELEKYCLDDVKITRDLYEYGKRHGSIYYQSPWGRREVKVNWKNQEAPKGNAVPMTLGI